jgi:uncharacterized protein YukE
VQWDLEVLDNTLRTLEQKCEALGNQRNIMQAHRERVGANWKSTAGRDYQGRMQSDMDTINHIITQLQNRIVSLRKVLGHYTQCEREIQTALNQLRRK